MDEASEFFRALRGVVPANDVRMSGAWSAHHQRRYASPEQAGTGEGPYLETVDWHWGGSVESVVPFVGLALLATDQRLFWVKSQPPVIRAPVSVSASGWNDRPSPVSFTGAFHGAYPPSVPVEITDEPPKSCVIGSSRTTTGSLQVVARLGPGLFGIVLLPGSVVRVGRNRLWHLDERLASKLAPDLQRLLTRGRNGTIELTR